MVRGCLKKRSQTSWYGDLRPQVDGGQLAIHLALEGVAVDSDEGTRQSERLDVGVGENAAAQLCSSEGAASASSWKVISSRLVP